MQPDVQPRLEVKLSALFAQIGQTVYHGIGFGAEALLERRKKRLGLLGRAEGEPPARLRP